MKTTLYFNIGGSGQTKAFDKSNLSTARTARSVGVALEVDGLIVFSSLSTDEARILGNQLVRLADAADTDTSLRRPLPALKGSEFNHLRQRLGRLDALRKKAFRLSRTPGLSKRDQRAYKSTLYNLDRCRALLSSVLESNHSTTP